MKKTLFFVALATALGYNNAEAVDWNWKGDIRYRYQSEIQEDADHSRDRHRLRVRFGVNPWINEELSAGLRLSTDSSETTSRNQSLQDGFKTKNIAFDEVYIDYHPMFLNGDVNVLLGKREVAKTLFVEKDLVWDSDLTFEGATFQYGKDIDGKQKSGLGAVVGWYSLDEDKAEQDPYLFVAQGAYKGEVSDLGFDLGVGYYDFVHFDLDNSAAGLGFEPKFDYRGKDFNIVEFFGSIGGDITESVPWKLYGQYAFNTASNDDNINIDESERDAWLAGLKIGKAKNPGQLEGSAEYVSIERDAVTYLTDSDRNAPASYKTNIKGVKLNATYHLVQNMTIGATYMNFSRLHDLGVAKETSKTNHLLQADVVVKF
ncbi:MAG: putative porin [Chlorobiaceae bacterium]|nr:putative porin [Chlorobiaceae bacterium]